MSAPHFWILQDNRIGHNSQIQGMMDALGYPYSVVNLSYSRLAALPNFLKKGWHGVRSSDWHDLPKPQAILSAGRRQVPFVLKLRDELVAEGQPAPKLIHLMNPGSAIDQFDLVVAPWHDHLPKLKNVMTYLLPPHRFLPAKIAAHAAQIESIYAEDFRRPYLVVNIGGKNKRHDFKDQDMVNLARQLADVITEANGSLLVTFSRRTSPAHMDIFKSFFVDANIPIHIYDPRENKPNPYLDYLALGDAFIVSGDSVSMISESLITGKPVYIFAPKNLCSPRHLRLHQELYRQGLAKPFESGLAWQEGPSYASAQVIANQIRTRFFPWTKIAS